MSDFKLMTDFSVIAREAYLEGYRSGFQDGIDLPTDDPDIDQFWEQSKVAKKLLDLIRVFNEESRHVQP